MVNYEVKGLQETLPVFKDVLEYALNYYGFSHDKR
jgi:hypothetical protein